MRATVAAGSAFAIVRSNTRFFERQRAMSEGKSDSVWSDTMDVAEHERTFEGFVAFTKYGIYGCTVLLILMAIFLL